MIFNNLTEIYNDARSKAKKEYNRRKARGLSGHLTSLDGLIKDVDIMTTVDLGEREIPLKKIKGTYSNFRRMTFSKNFLPLENAHSEFASKWMNLCDAHLEEGIRDPIKVYEYMNFFYVIEGNKRVSVLKYYDASSIQARILRLVPKYEDDPDVKLYYRFLEFNKKTDLNQIWLSRRSDYDLMEEALENYDPEIRFYDDKYQLFLHEIYMPFRQYYKAHGGDRLNVTTGDAFALFVKIYNIPEAITEKDMKMIIPKLISELSTRDLDVSSTIQSSSEVMDKTSIIESISGLIGAKRLKIAFIYAKEIRKSGWSYSHELGRLAVQNKFSSNITIDSYENVSDELELRKLIDELVKQGYKAIFTTASIHRKATLSAALLHDQVKFFNCSGSRPYVHMSSYYGRSYETRFLTGMIAGAMTTSNVLGYTAAMPSADTISCINAYALGAKMVNPNVVVKVSYTGVWNSPSDNEKKIKVLIGEGADLISSKNNILSREATKSYGITSMLCSVNIEEKCLEEYLAAPIWKWEVFYTKIIGAMLNGSYDRIIGTKSKSLINFWWGLESGGIDVYMNENVPTETRKLVNLMKRMMISGQYNPFSGPIKDQLGEIKVKENEVLPLEDIISMDWYVSNVKILDV